MRQTADLTQYQAAERKRTLAAAIIILIAVPATVLAGTFAASGSLYIAAGFALVIETMIPFFMVFEQRKPKAREIVLIAMMTALTVAVHMFFHLTIPLAAGTAMVIISGIAMGPEAGFLVGALARLVCNFYMGQGPWTPWQMFCWGLLGFLAGLAFQKIDYAEAKKRGFIESLGIRRFRIILGPVLCMVFALAAAYVSLLIWPGGDGFAGWRLYVFGAAGLLAGVLLQRKRLSVDGLTMALFTLCSVFIVYGGVMNICAMVTTAMSGGGAPSWSALRALYITGVPYDALHAVTAAVFIFLFGDVIIRKIERIKIKYGIYR